MGVAYGVLAGLLAALPLLVALRRKSMAWGIGAVMVAFAAMHVAAALVRNLDRGALVPFAAFSALSFLAVVVIAALRQQ